MLHDIVTSMLFRLICYFWRTSSPTLFSVELSGKVLYTAHMTENEWEDCARDFSCRHDNKLYACAMYDIALGWCRLCVYWSVPARSPILSALLYCICCACCCTVLYSTNQMRECSVSLASMYNEQITLALTTHKAKNVDISTNLDKTMILVPSCFPRQNS